MKKCFCGGSLTEETAVTPEKINYKYFKCIKCNEEFLSLGQLHEAAENYRVIKK
ncbi:MAG: hypothetical protein AB1467_01360 [Candidatus Diapherotrites archaeon]